ncbi:hypothetical protein, partial [Klebsiella pneumoniae]|uniref:hypothetical protein n=1 Tax=Klebsiella pneumoniae TaxID=573 RepID=UPI0040555E98
LFPNLIRRDAVRHSVCLQWSVIWSVGNRIHSCGKNLQTVISPRKHQYYPFCCNIIALIVNNILQSSYHNQTTSLVSDTASFLTSLMEKNS